MSNYYTFPRASVVAISGELTGNAAQAVQYIARSSRLDGNNKSDNIEGRIDDLQKAIHFIDFEMARLSLQQVKEQQESANNEDC